MEPPCLFPSLPKDIVLSILARISRSYYPTFSLVSKSFRSLILSEELDTVRSQLGIREECVYVCLQSCTNLCDHRWFSLWIKPDDYHQTLIRCKIQDKCTDNWLVPIPSSNSPCLPSFHQTVGSETYQICGQSTPSSDVWVYNTLLGKRHKAPSMIEARRNALMCSFDDKLYVMGGCEANESTYWAEVFDPKTKTWKPLPDPEVGLRFSSVKKLEAHRGKIYIRTKNKSFVYLTKQSKWEVVEANLGESMCKIDNVYYCYDQSKCLWYDTKCEVWRFVKGLSELEGHYTSDTEICNYGGKLLSVWINPVRNSLTENPKLWCAVISLEKRNDWEIWGKIEWIDVVLTIPKSYTLLRCMETLQ